MFCLQHNMWCKMSNFELGVRVPLMIHVPWKPSSAGKHTQELAELVDMYPTLADLAGKAVWSPPACNKCISPTIAMQDTPNQKNHGLRNQFWESPNGGVKGFWIFLSLKKKKVADKGAIRNDHDELEHDGLWRQFCWLKHNYLLFSFTNPVMS